MSGNRFDVARWLPGANAPRTAPNLNRVGVATHEENQTRRPKSPYQILCENSEELERLLRALPQVQQVFADIRKGLRTRSNWIQVYDFDTASGSLNGTDNDQGFILDAARETGGYPFDTFGMQSVGGGALEASFNGCKWLPLAATTEFDNVEIWELRIRTTTPATGTGRMALTAYVPGIGGNRGF